MFNLRTTSTTSVVEGRPTTKRNVAMEDFQEMDVEGEESEMKQNQKPIRRQRRSKKVPLIAIVGRPNVGKIRRIG